MKKQHYHILFLLPLLLSVMCCQPGARSTSSSLDQKSAPNEMFVFQRSYPDTVFDWKGWRLALELEQVKTKAAFQNKVNNDCGEQSPDWTLQGPSNVAGRCNTLAVKRDDENTVLAGFSAGGIFKSTDGGINWNPVFDDHLQLSIGDITFDPNDPNVVYAGTGDPNMPSVVFNGDGVYKSVDAGETWSYIGLSEQGIISKVVIDAERSDILFAAAMGNPYARDHERGIYKSTDGGVTWKQVLFVSDQAGASDLVQSPANPKILYASFWDRIRNNHESIVYGPNAKVFKSADGGETWSQLTGGLPVGVYGRTGLAISQQNADKVYAVYIDSLSTPQGLYKTTDGGNSWTSVNITSLETSCGDFGWYFGKIRLNPTNDEDVYFLAIQLHRKLPGSSNWILAGGGHSDSHDLIYTTSGRRYWANDGGVYRNDAGQMSWIKCKNLPLTQFYHTDFNLHEPNNYWGGAQDNGIQKGHGGADINNWTSVAPADGFNCAFHPTDPQTFWVEIQNGAINRTFDGGNSWQYGGTALGTTDRTNWDTPFFMSRHNPDKFFGATYRVYVSPDGAGWGAISPDLTDGIIFGARFHTVSALAESPVTPDKLMAGTSDGNVWRRENTGGWVNITGSLPNRYVTSVHLSPTVANRLYVTHSGFRDDEYIPHIHRSDNNGSTWVDISSDLPQVPINDLLVLPGYADSVLVVATDAGVYFSKTKGGKWLRLGGNMPIIPVFDLEQNPVRKEIVAATYARGMWTMPIDSILAQKPPVTVHLSGSVTTENGDGVLDVQVGSVKTGADGLFQFNEVGCNDLSITPYRNDNPLNGLTTYDLVLISKHVLGVEPLGSPYKLIAADANRSNSITTFDIVSLRKLILGIDQVLANNTSWRFVPQYFQFPDPLNPFATSIPEKIESQLLTASLSNLHFVGIKVGDVNDSALPAATGSSDRTEGIWPLLLDWSSPDKNGRLEAMVSSSTENLEALQFSLQFDTAELVLESLEPIAAGIGIEHFGLHFSNTGIITAALDGFSPESSHPLFRLKFKSKSASYANRLLNIGNYPTPALAFATGGNPLLPVWSDSGPAAACYFYPNPVGAAGAWAVWKPAAKEDRQLGHLQIFDLNGRLVYAGPMLPYVPVHLEKSIFRQPGLYYWNETQSGSAGKILYCP